MTSMLLFLTVHSVQGAKDPNSMKDIGTKLDKLRADASDLALMSRQTADAEKRALFGRLADELAIEALELEQVVNRRSGHSGSFDPDKVVKLKAGPGRD